MKYSLLLATLLSTVTLFGVETVMDTTIEDSQPVTIEEISADLPAPQMVAGTPPPLAQPSTTYTQPQNNQTCAEPVLKEDEEIIINVVGQGVSPTTTASPAQAFALAKRAAVADAYRMIAERVKGVRIDGQDLIKNMMVKRSTVRTSVRAVVQNANITETTFKDGLCEVEMEVTLSHSDFAQ